MGNEEGASNRPKATPESADDPSSGATSKKTLSDIEEAQDDSGIAADDHASVPSPDGQFDEGERERPGDTETG